TALPHDRDELSLFYRHAAGPQCADLYLFIAIRLRNSFRHQNCTHTLDSPFSIDLMPTAVLIRNAMTIRIQTLRSHAFPRFSYLQPYYILRTLQEGDRKHHFIREQTISCSESFHRKDRPIEKDREDKPVLLKSSLSS